MTNSVLLYLIKYVNYVKEKICLKEAITSKCFHNSRCHYYDKGSWIVGIKIVLNFIRCWSPESNSYFDFSVANKYVSDKEFEVILCNESICTC